VEFATKPHLVMQMIEGAIAAGVAFSYFTADSGCGRDPALRGFCHERTIAYVMAVPVNLPLVGSRRQAIRPDQVAGRLTGADFERRSCGHGTKGERYYDWAAAAVTVKDQAGRRQGPHPAGTPVGERPRRHQYFLAHAPRHTDSRPDRRRRNEMEDRREQRARQGPARPVPTSIRSVNGPPGAGTSPPACSPPRSWRRPAPTFRTPLPTWEKTQELAVITAI
jgi:hypothetical protein